MPTTTTRTDRPAPLLAGERRRIAEGRAAIAADLDALLARHNAALGCNFVPAPVGPLAARG